MWVLVTAVATASLLGSMHCVGMCGPLAIWASGAGEQSTRGRVIVSTSLYHVGRLITYALAGLIAGTIGSLVEVGGQTLGFQLAAARVVGTLMVLLGIWKLARMAWPASDANSLELQPSRIGGLLAKLRPYVFRLPLSGRALAVGLLTTFLPCGWLYLFALVAAGTGSPLWGTIVMAAFWLGTVPALTALIAGTKSLSNQFVRLVPAVAASLLIITGGFTAAGRGFADLNSLSDIRSNVAVHGVSASETITSLKSAASTLPCCSDPTATTCNCSEDEDLASGLDDLLKTPLPCCATHDEATATEAITPALDSGS